MLPLIPGPRVSVENKTLVIEHWFGKARRVPLQGLSPHPKYGGFSLRGAINRFTGCGELNLVGPSVGEGGFTLKNVYNLSGLEDAVNGESNEASSGSDQAGTNPIELFSSEEKAERFCKEFRAYRDLVSDWIARQFGIRAVIAGLILGALLFFLSTGAIDSSIPEWLANLNYLAFGAVYLFVCGMIGTDPSQEVGNWAIVRERHDESVVSQCAGIPSFKETDLKHFVEKSLGEDEFAGIRIRYHQELDRFCFTPEPTQRALYFVGLIIAVVTGVAFGIAHLIT